MAMSKWGMILSKIGQGDPANIWSLVQVHFKLLSAHNPSNAKSNQSPSIKNF